ncbi:MAG: DNRLRE domain-containing protein [Bacteroidota bacterium]
MKKLVVFAFITLLLSSCGEEQKRFVFQPNADTGKDVSISHQNETGNWSSLDRIHMLSLSANDSIPNDARFLLRFGFRTIPETATIDSAYIYLAAIEPGHFGKNNSFNMCRIKNVWVNDKVNWQDQPSIDKESAVTFPAPTDNLQDYKIEVTNYVKDVLNKKYTNNGHMFMLEDETKSYKGLRFHSSNSENEEKRPKLVVYYKE